VRAPSRTGLLLVGLGAVLGAIALTVLPWFRGDVGVLRGSHSTTGDLGDVLDSLVSLRHDLGDKHAYRLGLSDYYFSWLGWLLLAAAVVVAVVAILPTSEGGAVRILGVLICLLGVTATFWAIDVYRADPELGGKPRPNVDYLPGDGPGYGAFLSHASAGFWVAVAAFVLIGVGAAHGPRRARTARTT
jgi:hypothetical protein